MDPAQRRLSSDCDASDMPLGNASSEKFNRQDGGFRGHGRGAGSSAAESVKTERFGMLPEHETRTAVDHDR